MARHKARPAGEQPDAPRSGATPKPPFSESRSRLLFIGGAVAIALAALLLRLTRLDYGGFWRDEATAAFWSQLSPGGLIAALREDVHAPLYSLLLGGWSLLAGTSEAGLRSLNAVLGALLIAAAAWAYVPVLGRGAALLVGMLLAFMPGVVLQDQQLGVYSLLLICATLALGAAARLLVPAGNARRAAAILAVALAGMVYTHMWSSLLWSALALAAGLRAAGELWQTRRLARPTRLLLLAHAAALAVWLPWLVTALRQAGSRTMDHLPPTPGFAEIWLISARFWFNDLPTAAIALAFIAAFALLALLDAAIWRRQPALRSVAGMLLLAFVVPHVLCLAYAPLRDIYYDRYALICAPAAAGMLVGAWRLLPWRGVALPAAGGGVALLLLLPLLRNGTSGMLYASSYEASPLREVAARIAAQAAPQDVIILYPEIYAPAFNWYFRGPQPQICYPTIGRVETVSYRTYADRIEDPAAPRNCAEAARRLCPPGGRVWLVYSRSPNFIGQRNGINYGTGLMQLLNHLQANFPGARVMPDEQFGGLPRDAEAAAAQPESGKGERRRLELKEPVALKLIIAP